MCFLITGIVGGFGDTALIGMRRGGKLCETLLANEECAGAMDMGGFYRVPAEPKKRI